MGVNVATSSEYEAEANRLRAQIGVTIGSVAIQSHPFEHGLRSGVTRGDRRFVVGGRV